MEIKLIILSLALILDRVVGDPPALWQKIPHPVVLFGKAISWGEKRFNRAGLSRNQLRNSGMWLMLALIGASILIGYLLEFSLSFMGLAGTAIEVLVVAVFLAQKSLADHVSDVARGLREGGVEGGRKAVSMIVGRNPEQLDETGVSRAAIESLAESSSDGVVAPVFWFLIAGLPGLLAYKLINTADSMIGYLNKRYRDFGRFAAKIDDLANYIPARLSGLFAVLGSGFNGQQDRAKKAFSLMWRDARLHRSPNAGWPESAFAGALDLALAGPRQYGTEKVESEFLNTEGKHDANAADIERALTLFWASMTVMTGLIMIAALVGFIYRLG